MKYQHSLAKGFQVIFPDFFLTIGHVGNDERVRANVDKSHQIAAVEKCAACGGKGKGSSYPAVSRFFELWVIFINRRINLLSEVLIIPHTSVQPGSLNNMLAFSHNHPIHVKEKSLFHFEGGGKIEKHFSGDVWKVGEKRWRGGERVCYPRFIDKTCFYSVHSPCCP